MRRCFDPFVLLVAAASVFLPAPPRAYAQNPDEVKRLCTQVFEKERYLEIFVACEPSHANEKGRKEFIDAPWHEKAAALWTCHRQGKARGLTPHEVGALELRASYD